MFEEWLMKKENEDIQQCGGTRKGSATGIVLITFALVLYLVIPLGKAAFERVYYAHMRERAIAMMDSAIFSIASDIDSVAYSEKQIKIRPEHYVSDAQGILVPKNASVDQEGNRITVSFDFEYPRVFSNRTGTIQVQAEYDFDLLRTPTY